METKGIETEVGKEMEEGVEAGVEEGLKELELDLDQDLENVVPPPRSILRKDAPTKKKAWYSRIVPGRKTKKNRVKIDESYNTTSEG